MSRGKKILVILIFIVGFGIMLYPAVSSYYNGLRFTMQAESYEAGLVDLTEEEIAAEWERARVYNENLSGDPVHDPFVPGSGSALPENYTECLNVDGVMGVVEIPKLGITLPIYHGTSEEVLRKGVGHVEGSALPVGQKGCHPVLTGHRGLPEAELFTRLDEMEVGDYFYLHILDEEFCYKVDQITVILPEEIEELTAYQEHDYVTLLTCTPYGVNTHRLLVRGERSNPPVEKQEEVWKLPQWVIPAALLLAILLLFAILRFRARRKVAIPEEKGKAGARKRRRRRKKAHCHC